MTTSKNRKLRGAMVGGGIGAFIGPVHRMAATMDGEAEFVAGAFSSNPKKSKKSGAALYLDPSRVYGSYDEMIAAESAHPADDRIDFVSIVTPNVTHLDIATKCLKAGFHVVCDKPITMDLAQAKQMRKAAKASGKIFAVTHNYTGYPMVKQARHMVSKGELGTINKVVMEYPQGWLSGLLTDSKKDLGIWRMDPSSAGGACCTGDIGTHAENLVRYITGLEIDQLCAELTSFIPTNTLDDDANMLIRYKGGAKGVLYASQISTGEENGVTIRVYGTKLGLEWHQENPNYLIVKDPRGFTQTLSKGNAILCKAAQESGRLPFGHPDGFIEAFANIYLEAFRAMRDCDQGKLKGSYDFPTIEDGVIGLAFVETVLASSRSNTKWTKMKS